MNRLFPLWIAAIGVVTLQGCPTTHVLVPSRATVPEMAKLSQSKGSVADVFTIEGEQLWLTVEPGPPEMFTGTLVFSAPAQHVSLPFDSLVLIYYTKPHSAKLPKPERFPLLAAAGAAEQAMSCEELSVATARAEALRWFARRRGATPYTAGEQRKLHAKHAATYVGNTLLAFVILVTASSGAGGNLLPVHESNEPLRWAVTAADERIAGLLPIRAGKNCTGRTTLQAETTDIQLWMTLDAARVPQKGAPVDEHAALTRRTEVFDQLGPKPVSSE